jgi:putative zinc finger/helix-turn-helix YgiT family protein
MPDAFALLDLPSQAPVELPFPWICGKCRQHAVERQTLPYSTEVQYDGRLYTVDVPEFRVPRCQNCGAMVLDDDANDQITEALRHQLGLLSPQQIRSNHEALGMRQRDLANLLGVGESTVSRWETGSQIQQKSLDKLMRLYFAIPEVRRALADRDRIAELGSEVVTQPMPQPEAETKLSHLAARLDVLAEKKRESILDEFLRLADLMIS